MRRPTDLRLKKSPFLGLLSAFVYTSVGLVILGAVGYGIFVLCGGEMLGYALGFLGVLVTMMIWQVADRFIVILITTEDDRKEVRDVVGAILRKSKQTETK